MKKQHIIDLIELGRDYLLEEDKIDKENNRIYYSDYRNILQDTLEEDNYNEIMLIDDIISATAGVDLSADDYLKIFEICKIEVEE